MNKRKITAAVTAAGIALFAGAADAETIPQRLMGDLARDFQLKDFQAAGIVGNLARETGNFRFMQELRPIVEGSRGGIGYSQWTASRRLAFEEYAGDLNKQLTYKVNYGFLKKELTEEYAYVIDDVRKSENLWESTVLFMRGYLRPKKNDHNVRVSMNYANAYLRGDYTGSGCQKNHEVSVDGRRITIATCPEAAVKVAGMTVDLVRDTASRPHPRPASLSAPRPVRVADTRVEHSSRPPVRPERPKEFMDMLRDAIMYATNTRLKEDPDDPLQDWDPFYARKENEPEDYEAAPEADGTYSMTV